MAAVCLLTLSCSLLPALVAAAPAARECASVHGFSWPHSAALPHLANVTDVAGCCAA